jgi:hypothetical protein
MVHTYIHMYILPQYLHGQPRYCSPENSNLINSRTIVYVFNSPNYVHNFQVVKLQLINKIDPWQIHNCLIVAAFNGP